MKPRALLSVVVAVMASASSLALGCSAPVVASTGDKPAPKGSDAPSANDEGTNPTPGSAGEATSAGPVGVVAIDVQQVFFDTATARNPKADVPSRMKRTAHVFELAKTNHVPVFITYEATKTGDHALPAMLATALPPQSMEFIKTTFAATGQPQFAAAIETPNVARFLVIGAETDVCVLQSVLGMRRAGLEVLALVDTLFTEEVNVAPALRRMRQAGVVQIEITEAEAILAGGRSKAPPASPPPVIVKPLSMGILLHDLEGLNAADANASAKMVRLRELLLISEWFRLPVLAADPAHATSLLPANLRSILTRPIVALANRPAQVTQLAIAGGHTSLAQTVDALKKSVDVFVVEDSLLGGSANELEPLYVGGAVPTTYKTLYYELTQSVSDAQWPSQQWVTDGKARYYDMTMAPEELPPLSL